MTSQFTYFGILKAPTSWAKVCRELVHALLQKNVDVNIYERKGFLYDEAFPLHETLKSRHVKSFRDDIVFTFEHPQTYEYLRGSKKIGLLTYESTVVPDKWIDEANKHLDLLLVSSIFCKDIFIDAGMDPDRIEILNYGYNPQVYQPEGPQIFLDEITNKKYRFLTVASPHKRKGLELLLQAYKNAFTASDDVCLIVKVNYVPNTKKGKPFEYRNLQQLFHNFEKEKNSPQVALLHGYYDEEKMASLYRSCSSLVSATRGEGFGMVFLEALACGLPLIVTGWSGHMDFLNRENATLVKYTLRAAGEIQYDCCSPHSKIAEPDVHDLAKKMFLAAKKNTGKPSLKAPKSLTWQALADRFLEIINQRFPV